MSAANNLLHCDYAFDYWGKGTTVTVSSGKTNAPTVFPLTQCDSGTGDTVTVGCLATNFTPSPVTFKWSNNGNDLTDFIQYPSVQTGNYFTGVSQIQVKRADWNTNSTFKCTATHQGQEVTADVKPPEVFYQLPTLEVLSICEDNAQTASFSCFAKDFSAREYDIKWLKNEQEISNSVYEIKTPSGKTQYENGTTVYNAASFLKVQASEWTDPGTKFTCEFKGKDGTGDMYVNASLTYTPQKENGEVKPEHLMDIDLIPPTLEKMFLNKQGELVCKVIPKPHEGNFVKVSWEDDKGHELIESMNVEGKKGPFSLSLNILYEEWSAGFKRFCVVHHTELPTPAKTPYERKSGGKPQHPSVFLLAPVEQTKNKEVTLTCLVKDFFPKEIIVSWLVNDKPADPETIRTTNPLESEGSYSVYGKISVNLDKWMNDKEVYSCVVYHESVINTTGVLIRSMVERSDEKTTMVNLNMNIGQTCMAQ
ncbi:hypothetical protein LDENG_00141150 [Lucifuga dentata]|nr:hypothetical protein LDENG_00141150 [Lucifuga dentata]